MGESDIVNTKAAGIFKKIISKDGTFPTLETGFRGITAVFHAAVMYLYHTYARMRIFFHKISQGGGSATLDVRHTPVVCADCVPKQGCRHDIMQIESGLDYVCTGCFFRFSTLPWLFLWSMWKESEKREDKVAGN